MNNATKSAYRLSKEADCLIETGYKEDILFSKTFKELTKRNICQEEYI